jgi:CRISPR system Cascade subunit CasB
MTKTLAPYLGAVAASWWRGLQPGPDGGGDRAALARLRRAATAAEAAAEPATLDLCRRLGWDWCRLAPVAVTASVLAHVREDDPGRPVARQLGPPDAAMSWLRFRRLVQADTDDDRLTAFRRAVALARGRLNVSDLARSLLDWDEQQRRRWLFAYHDAPAPAPDERADEQGASDIKDDAA